ncbi:DUF5615 family PIN-like protein [Kiritimatiella glycovorans]|uniref:DUF5615 domain-containing protein n=1 Tax=Kiritimatiella glycovorans TaxID=1307763 RepID=A0A0G3EE37_9BACT|nr:DUF5615 family PIN-like protein [Kiritimatiella glycovorans]AKJ64721.1 hypothetical protein L21SP4_01475 [Kiritimatiella glycovorans]
MKLLFDQNLSFKLVQRLTVSFPGSKHIRDFALVREMDESIWVFAAKNGFTIVSKDSDFVHLSMVQGHPPKVVHVRFGNCSTNTILDRMIAHEHAIKEFISDSDESFLVLE